MQLSLVTLFGRDIFGFVIKLVLQLLQCYSDVNQTDVGETRHCDTYEGIFNLSTQDPFKLQCDYGMIWPLFLNGYMES